MKTGRLILILLLYTSLVFGGNNFFSMYNGRNHPELKWQSLETEHIRILYHQGLAEQARQAARVAEACYPDITKNLKHEPPGKIPIFISDQDDITNGFSVMDRFIAIWVNVNDYVEWTTGTDKWLRMVIGHEMVHYVHFSAIRTWLGFLGFGINGTPGWFIEGLAQYESETWNVHRGDLLLRTAVIEDEMNYMAGKWPTNGRLMYAEGNSMVRYIADQYGDSSLVNILHDRKKFLGLSNYSFGSAFSKALNKKSGEDFFREWRRYVNIYYNTWYGQKEPLKDYTKPVKLPLLYIDDIQYSPDESWIAAAGLTDLDEPLIKLCIIKNDSTRKTKILVESGVGPQISYSPDGREIAYSRVRRGKHGSLQEDLFVTTVKGKSRRITTDAAASLPDWSPDGQWLVFVTTQGSTANLYKIKPDGSDVSPVTDFSGDVQLQSPRWSPDGRYIAAAIADAQGNRDIILVNAENGQARKLTDDTADDRVPVWSPTGQTLAFTSYRTGTPDVWTIDIEDTGAVPVQLTDAPGGIYGADWVADSLVCRFVDSRRKTTALKIDVNHKPQVTDFSIRPEYKSWTTHRPPNGIPPMSLADMPEPEMIDTGAYHPIRDIQHYITVPIPGQLEDNWGLYGLTAWSDPLAKHVITGFGFIDAQEIKQSRYIVTYMNSSFAPTITTSLFHIPYTGQILEDKVLVEEATGGVIDVAMPLNFGDNLYSNHLVSVSASWIKNKPDNPEDFKDTAFAIQERTVGEFGFTYSWRSQRPNLNNYIHPTQGMGLQLGFAAADSKWNSDLTYKLYHGDSYINWKIPGFGDVFYLRAMGQASSGQLLAQNVIGFDKYDQPEFGPGLKFSDREHIRGINEYRFGDRLWMITAEYRMDLVDNLGWQAAGIQLGHLTLAGFTDIGSVWYNDQENWRDAEILKTWGVEFKNEVNFGGFIFSHEVGWAWPYTYKPQPTSYYRVKAVMPF